ncbi:type I-E CRISPR-associated protein Cse1/CasA [Rhizohabitans arisaemae]|uniref:type I-E CRISPR-associated protein Cse1/CasA n=1 Tax=Rhizohabitans arisaemae TaxID=2720610 RepID=UPI0024B1E264|nr:type I-E CRISPR-associated protein Cse1/CasA [Rhizohabitans arisaemae]
MPDFDLIDSKWIPVIRRGDGPPIEVSLRQALLDAHEWKFLAGDVPTQVPALLRQVLLPILVHALGQPRNEAAWGRGFAAGRFSQAERDRLDEYLENVRLRFDLFHETTPFAQVSKLRTAKNETKGTALLVATAASGNNVPLFSSRTEGDPLLLTPAKAARWLIHAHCWDTAAIKSGAADDPQAKSGKTMGNPTGPLGSLGVIVPLGESLYETLLLNTPIGTMPCDDRPQWGAEVDDEGARRPPRPGVWEIRPALGLLDLWTWQSRRIRLVPEQTSEGLRVQRVVICAGDRLSARPEWEPHTAWTYQKPAKGDSLPARRPKRHTAGKAAWRGLNALLALEQPSQDGGSETSILIRQLARFESQGHIPADYPLRVQTIGISYGTQSAVIEDVLFDEIPLPVAALRTDFDVYSTLIEVVEQAEELARAVNILSGDLRRAMGTDPIPWDKGQRPGELVLHALDPLVRRLLAGVQAASEDGDLLAQGRTAWETVAWKRTVEVAEQVLSNTAPHAFRGRTRKSDSKAKGEQSFRLATAERDFRRRLRYALPRASEIFQQRKTDDLA